MLSTNSRVNRPFGSGKEAKKKKFQDGRNGGSYRFPIGTILILIYKSPQCFLPSLESIGLSFQENKRKTDF